MDAAVLGVGGGAVRGGAVQAQRQQPLPQVLEAVRLLQLRAGRMVSCHPYTRRPHCNGAFAGLHGISGRARMRLRQLATCGQACIGRY